MTLSALTFFSPGDSFTALSENTCTLLMCILLIPQLMFYFARSLLGGFKTAGSSSPGNKD